MKILAIESSCDETAAAVVEDGRKILSNVVNTQIAEHRLYGGVVPEIASRRHMENICSVVSQALNTANENLDSIDAIAVTYAPGLIGALLVGVNFAKGLSLASNKPLIPVHHIRGHVAANYLAFPSLKPPFLCLSVSGGNSLILKVDDYTKITVLGKSMDDSAGECMDKAARCMGFSYPGGKEIDFHARLGDENKYKFPMAHVEGHPLDMSFSGMKTSIINLIHNAEQKNEKPDINSLCASFEKAVVNELISRLKLAMEQTHISRVCIAGGVSANTRLRREAQKLGALMPPISLTGDNGAMIGSQAYYEYLDNNIAKDDLNAFATREI